MINRNDDEIPLDDIDDALARMADLGHVLTPRQVELACLIAVGLTNREISKRMKISIKTVDTHRARVIAALDVRNNVELARYAIRVGLVPAP